MRVEYHVTADVAYIYLAQSMGDTNVYMAQSMMYVDVGDTTLYFSPLGVLLGLKVQAASKHVSVALLATAEKL